MTKMQTPLAPPRPPTTLNKRSRCGSKIMTSIIGEMFKGACQKKMFTLTRHLRARAAALSPMILSVCISDHLLRRIRGETCFGFGMSGFTASWRRTRPVKPESITICADLSVVRRAKNGSLPSSQEDTFVPPCF